MKENRRGVVFAIVTLTEERHASLWKGGTALLLHKNRFARSVFGD